MTSASLLGQTWYAAYLASGPSMPIDVSFERFCFYLQDFDVIPVIKDFEIKGAFLVRGPEIHTCMLKGEEQWLTRKLIRCVLAPIMKRYGYATTYAFIEDKEAQRFAEKIGFTGQKICDDSVILYKLEKKSCRQSFLSQPQ